MFVLSEAQHNKDNFELQPLFYHLPCSFLAKIAEGLPKQHRIKVEIFTPQCDPRMIAVIQ